MNGQKDGLTQLGIHDDWHGRSPFFCPHHLSAKSKTLTT
jgi:hypothetical protein